MKQEYPFLEGEERTKITYLNETSYLIDTKNYRILGYICKNKDMMIKTIAKDFAYFKILRRISDIFAKPIKLYIGTEGKQIHVQQVFKRYGEYPSESSKLNEFIVSSIKALSVVNDPELIIHPLMVSYCHTKNKWHICLVRSGFEKLPSVAAWLISISHIITRPEEAKFLDDIREANKEMKEGEKNLKAFLTQKVTALLSKDKKYIELLKLAFNLDKDYTKLIEKIEAKLKVKKSTSEWKDEMAKHILQKTNCLISNKDESAYNRLVRKYAFKEIELKEVLLKLKASYLPNINNSREFIIDENEGLVHVGTL